MLKHRVKKNRKTSIIHEMLSERSVLIKEDSVCLRDGIVIGYNISDTARVHTFFHYASENGTWL